jgi:7,8-dihydro-6-hydroxymethylpterin-pyrophosphokinase
MKTLEGADSIRRILQQISSEGDVHTISSIYRRRNQMRPNDLETPIEFVIHFATERSASALADFFRAFLSKIPLRHEGDLLFTLLSFDGEVLMTPEMTLPHPSLHADALVCRCASEAWGTFEHPVLKKTMAQIATMIPPVTDAEFWMQGQSRVDFS